MFDVASSCSTSVFTTPWKRARERGRDSETGILLHKHRREDRLRHRREHERKHRTPETGGTLEKAMELVQSHSQRILSYSSSPACTVGVL